MSVEKRLMSENFITKSLLQRWKIQGCTADNCLNMQDTILSNYDYAVKECIITWSGDKLS